MKVLMDGRPLQHGSSVRGIGSYARGLLQAYAELHRAGDVTLLLSQHGAAPAEVQRLGVGIAASRIPVLQFSVQQMLDPLLVARALRAERPDLYHGIEFGQPLQASCPVVMTVHDLIPFVFKQDYPWLHRSRAAALRLLRRADHIIADSQSTANDVTRIAKVPRERITVVHIGIAPVFRHLEEAQVEPVLARLEIRRPYLLAVGTFDPRKRIALLAQVMQRIRKHADAQLVIAGDQGAFADQVRSALREHDVEQCTVLTGHISESDLIALYSGAACLLFTSAYEGFGLPPLESIACGTPAVVFDNSSLPEVCGDAARLVADGDVQAMAEAALELLEDDSRRAALVERGRQHVQRFTWRQAAERTLAVYDSVLQR